MENSTDAGSGGSPLVGLAILALPLLTLCIIIRSCAFLMAKKGTSTKPTRVPVPCCASKSCVLLRHSTPPSQFTKDDNKYCCIACRNSNGKKHGAACEGFVAVDATNRATSNPRKASSIPPPAADKATKEYALSSFRIDSSNFNRVAHTALPDQSRTTTAETLRKRLPNKSSSTEERRNNKEAAAQLILPKVVSKQKAMAVKQQPPPQQPHALKQQRLEQGDMLSADADDRGGLYDDYMPAPVRAPLPEPESDELKPIRFSKKKVKKGKR